jgi:hypothetical protein
LLRIPIGDRKGVVLACILCPRVFDKVAARIGLGVIVAPVDRLGPTLKPDPFLTPDFGWNGSRTASGAELAPDYADRPLQRNP